MNNVTETTYTTMTPTPTGWDLDNGYIFGQVTVNNDGTARFYCEDVRGTASSELNALMIVQQTIEDKS